MIWIIKSFNPWWWFGSFIFVLLNLIPELLILFWAWTRSCLIQSLPNFFRFAKINEWFIECNFFNIVKEIFRVKVVIFLRLCSWWILSRWFSRWDILKHKEFLLIGFLFLFDKQLELIINWKFEMFLTHFPFQFLKFHFLANCRSRWFHRDLLRILLFSNFNGYFLPIWLYKVVFVPWLPLC